MNRKYSRGTKMVAGLTSIAFAAMGCAAQDGAPGVEAGEREVTMEVWTNLADESGTRKLQQLGTSSFALGEYAGWERPFTVDGGESTDLSSVADGAEMVVPLNNGETATLVRRADRLELVSFTGEDDGSSELPRGAVSAVRMLPDGIEVFLAGSGSKEPDTIVRLSGIDDLDQERSALIESLTLSSLLVSLEDQEQIAAVVAIAIIVAVVGSAWMAVCGGLAWECAYRCEASNGFETQCASLTVKVNPTEVQVGGGYGCRCL